MLLLKNLMIKRERNRMVDSKNDKDKLGARLGQVFYYCDFKGLVELSLFIGKGEKVSGEKEMLMKVKVSALKGSEQSQN